LAFLTGVATGRMGPPGGATSRMETWKEMG
jgi:hypothetical protein